MIRMQPHAERRPRIVDDHLVFAGDVALRVVADSADAQAANVVADFHRQVHRPSRSFRILHAVDEERHAHDRLGRLDRYEEIAVDERGGFQGDEDGLGIRGLNRCDREKNDER